MKTSKVLLTLTFFFVVALSVYGYFNPSMVSVAKSMASSVVSSTSSQSTKLNIGTIEIRAIVANIDELGDRYGSYGQKFTQSKLTEVEQALSRLNKFVKQSSYGQTTLKYTAAGVFELGSGVCTQTTYGDQVNDLIQRALVAADAVKPLKDYSHYLIVHPLPDCADGVTWSYEGRGQFKSYILNGKTVHLRGIRISELSDQYLFHEFGHTLAYQDNTSIGHPDYLNCPVTLSGGINNIVISDSCPHIYDYYTGETPIFTMMSTPSILSDYSAIEKEIAGWLSSKNIVTTTSGTYKLSPLEQNTSKQKVLKIPVVGTNYNVYLSFRQPKGYTYPATENSKPNGVIMDIVSGANASFLVTDSLNKDAPLEVGKPYRLGTNGPIITVSKISKNIATVSVTSSTTSSAK